jgi:hypothetical protein
MAKTIGQLTQATTLGNSDEFVIEQSGLTKRVAASVVRGGLVNSDIDAAAAIAFSKLAALDSANLLVGNGSNVATKVAVTGDVTISNAGVTAIGSAKVTPTMLTQPLTLETAKATTSGKSVEFTAIPSWVKRITMMLNGVSTTGTNNILIQLGTSAGYQTSGYGGAVLVSQGGSVGSVAHSTGFLVDSTTLAADTRSGIVGFNFVGTSNVWSAAGNVSLTAAARNSVFSGTVLLAGTLDRIRITTTDDFDAGSVNIMYEG